MSNVGLAVHFFAQIAIILIACRVVGNVAKRIGQPQVVAEMITGVLLGPSLLGLFAPEWQAFIFPWDSSQSTRDTQSYLFPIAQLGLALYMFIVGMEFRMDIISQNLKCSIAVSLAGMLAPFLLGAALGWYFFTSTDLFPERTSATEAMLFLGAAMCITAFPMLARIIHFKQLAGTRMGTIAIGAGAIDDATAWCLLAVVLASFDNDWTLAVQNIGGGIVYVILALVVIRPALSYWQSRLVQEGELSDVGLALGIAMMAAGACFTDYVGLHAVFGAFIMGAAMPRGAVSRGLIERIQPLAVGLLLPMFFTYSGLNTKIGLLNSWSMWGLCVLVLLAAVLGKGGGCWLAAILSKLPNREALGIATLMNSRGLMELIVINVGLERGIISESLFAMLVIMAILTTLVASPLFDHLAGSDVSDRTHKRS